MFVVLFFFFKQKTAYEMRISDWSSDVCSSDLLSGGADDGSQGQAFGAVGGLGVGSDRLVERHGVVAHEDPPAILSHSVEDHGGGLGRGHRSGVAEHLPEHLGDLEQLLNGHPLGPEAPLLHALADQRDLLTLLGRRLGPTRDLSAFTCYVDTYLART